MPDFRCRWEERGQKRCAVECQSCHIWNQEPGRLPRPPENPKIESENPKIDRNPKIDWFVWALSIFCIFYLATRPRPHPPNVVLVPDRADRPDDPPG